MDILEIAKNTLKAKVVPAFGEIKQMWDMKPKDENDYYTIGVWMLSKKLAFAVVILTGVLCGAYLWMVKPEKAETGSTYKIYKYNSIPLKFLKGRAVILGQSGYRAYEGDVEGGMVKGAGRLYDKAGNLLYEGEFDRNAYNGTGKSYYKGGILAYEGTFADNLYDGTGKAYRKNGMPLYEGEFEKGHMEGEGILYNAGGDVAYTGLFHRDEVLYQELLGKTTEEAAGMYTGSRMIYETGDGYLVYMKDIDAAYAGTERGSTLEEEVTISSVYVMKNYLCPDGKEMTRILEILQYFGEPVYQGYTYLSGQDELVLNGMNGGDEVLSGPAKLKLGKVFEDVASLDDYERNYEVYIYVFDMDGILYTFFAGDKNQDFAFYMMEQE